MALTETRRNEIAHLKNLHDLASNKVVSLESLQERIKEYTTATEDEAELLGLFLMFDMLRNVVGNLVKGPSWYQSNTHKTMVDRLEYLHWEYVVECNIRDGIKIGNVTKRKVGNEAQKLGITTDEAMEFAKEVVAEIVKKTFA